MTSDNCIGLELVSDNAIKKWRDVIGPTNSTVAKQTASQSIRGRFGVDGTLNAVHGSDAQSSFERESGFWFGGNEPSKRPM
jgi:nucleoside diphosphate kinase